MHLVKFKVDKIQNGRLSAIIHPDRPDIVEYHENRSRYLHHYCISPCIMRCFFLAIHVTKRYLVLYIDVEFNINF